MPFDKKAWMRVYMRAYRRGKRRKPRPGYFDKKAWSRPYMREYMRKVRARQKLERERDEAVNAAIVRLSSMRASCTAHLSVSDRLARLEAISADIQLLLEVTQTQPGNPCHWAASNSYVTAMAMSHVDSVGRTSADQYRRKE